MERTYLDKTVHRTYCVIVFLTTVNILCHVREVCHNVHKPFLFGMFDVWEHVMKTKIYYFLYHYLKEMWKLGSEQKLYIGSLI